MWTTIGELLCNRDEERIPVSSAIRKKQTNKIYDYYGAAGVIDKVDSFLFNERLLLIGEDGANLLSRAKDNAFFAEGKYWVNNHAHILDCSDKEILNYVALVINAMDLNPYITGTAQPKLNQDNLNKIFIPLPPKREQGEIISVVGRLEKVVQDLVDSARIMNILIDKAKAMILTLAISGKLVPQDPADEPAINLLKRINPDFVPCDNSHYPVELPSGWTTMPLGHICDTINGLWKGKKEPFVSIGVIRNANFTKDFKLDYSNIEYLDVEASSFAKRALKNGDLIVEKSGGSEKNPVGRAILYEGESGKYSFSNFTMALRIKDCRIMNSHFLYYAIMAYYLRGDMSKMQTQTTGLHNLIGDKYLSMLIPLPPIEEQMRIVKKIELLFTSLNEIKATLC